MMLKLRRFAPLALWLALFAALTAGVLYILQREWNLPLQISLGLVVIGLAVFGLLDPGSVRRMFTGRQARYGSNAIVLLVAVVGILVVINYFTYENDQRWDLTEDKENTLSDATLEVLGQLSGQVTAQAFFTPEKSPDTAKSLLDQYEFESDGKFSYEFIDPVSDPVAANEADVTQDGSVVLRMGDARQMVVTLTENEITSALIRLMNPSGKVVYFLTGHGELSIEDSGDVAYSQLKEELEGKNYKVLTLNLLATKQIPNDANVIVVGAPQISLDEAEITQLTEFLSNGGALVVMEEPPLLTQMVDRADFLADYLAENWGVLLGKDIVVDLNTEQIFMAYANEYSSHVISQKMQNIITVFPTARSVTVADVANDNISPVSLLSTSDQSWAETDFASLSAGGSIQADLGSDLAGPVSLAVAAEDASTNARLVVFGDAEFSTNAFFTAYGNGAMIVNSIDWAAGEEEIINLPTKERTTRTLVVPNALSMGLLFLGSLIILPGIVLAGGITAWIIRRKQG